VALVDPATTLPGKISSRFPRRVHRRASTSTPEDSMKISIIAQIPDELADPDDDTGVTNDAYEQIMDACMSLGMDDIDIQKVTAQ
jgi:hypothetical protein